MEYLTASRLRAFRKCARYEKIAYVDRWRPAKDPDALHFGTLVHMGLEAWGKARMEGRHENAMNDAIDAVANRAYDGETQAKVQVLLEGYDARWGEEPEVILGVEEIFTIPLSNPETWRDSQTWGFAGKVDARVLMPDGTMMIREHKTCSEQIDQPDAPYWKKLAMDHQVSAYMLGAEAIARAEGTALPVGCQYDVIRKPGQRLCKATPEAERKYTKEKVDKRTGEIIEPSRLYANQREADEGIEEFYWRVRAEVFANLEWYFVRKTVPRTQSQLSEFMGDAWDQGRVMRESHIAGRAPRNPEACHAYGECAFWPICSTNADPAMFPSDFIRSEVAHPELSL